jgi:two-component system response regulator FlrC
MKVQGILIVDDDLPSRVAMEKVLKVCGYEIFSCESGEHAVVKIREESSGVLITDFQMRGMDGLELIRVARRIKPEISAILVTGFATEEMRVKATTRCERVSPPTC